MSRSLRTLRPCLAAAIFALSAQGLLATDYFLTIGGGYNPSGNQASLEANVVFFQQILEEKHHGPRRHDVYFADGHDEAADLQVLATKPRKENLPATDVLAALHRRRGAEQVEYRNHQVSPISGALDPALIRADIEGIAKKAQPGDRLIVYVTAHGSPGGRGGGGNAPSGDSHNTTIDCWKERRITAREFTRWLNGLPSSVPVVLVMAQCYCGGFAHTIFEDLDPAKGLSTHVRTGFFAQQHNLPAAGCRPDISNDAEFSSYFWGAIAGRTRTGAPVTEVDLDGNGAVSFSEAYAYAVIASPTIDIPLKSSDALLRKFSRIGGDKSNTPEEKPSDKPADGDKPVEADATAAAETEPSTPQPELAAMTGSLKGFAEQGRPVTARMVVALSKDLGFSMDDDVSKLNAAYAEHRRTARGPGRGMGPRRRPGSGRRELLQEIGEKWPELADERHWEESSLLKPENQEQLLADLKQLPSWKTFDQRRQQTADSAEQAERHELRDVKFRRLITTLETIVLEVNLPKLAKPHVIEHYHRMVTLEDSAFDPGTTR